MNNQIKSNIELEYLSEKELNPNNKGLVVLFKHDYYSTNSPHGKELLSNILYSLNSDSISIAKVMFIDNGVSLLDVDSIYNSDISSLLEKTQTAFVCSESLEEYRTELIDRNNLIVADAELFFEQLFTSKPDIIID